MTTSIRQMLLLRMLTNVIPELMQSISQPEMTSPKLLFLNDILNPIPHGLWDIRCYTGGAIMAQVFLRSHRFTQRPPTTLNLLPDKYFDLWLSIDTKNSPLCGILLRLRAVKWRWSKMKIFKRKKVKISNFGLQKCYIPQKKAENIYNKDSARKSKISCKKNNFFSIFQFFA